MWCRPGGWGYKVPKGGKIGDICTSVNNKKYLKSKAKII